jgi:hypothetical protein
MQKKLITSVASLVALAAFMVVPALASASPVLTENGVALATGVKIQGTSTTSIVFDTGSSSTTVTCAKSVLTGSVIKNKENHIEGTITAASFTNATGGECSSPLGAVNVTTEIATVDWCITAGGSLAADTFTTRAGACGAAAKPLNFTLHVTTFLGTITCKYTRAAASPVQGSFTTGGADAILSFSSQAFAPVAGNPGSCPGEGKLNGSYTLETDGGAGIVIS